MATYGLIGLPEDQNWFPDEASVGVGGLPVQRSITLPSAVGIQTLDLTPEEQNLYRHHLDNVRGKKAVRNDDGSVSTIRNITVEHDGRQYVIPTVWDGKIPDNHAAVKKAASVGWNYWPSYGDPDEADARYMQMHDMMAPDVEGY